MEQLPFAVDEALPQTTVSQASLVPKEPPKNSDEETIEFAYINITDEDEVDVWLDGDTLGNASVHEEQPAKGDILTILLEDRMQKNPLLSQTEPAYQASQDAITAQQNGDLQSALDCHTNAANLFHEAAVLARDRDGKLHVVDSMA